MVIATVEGLRARGYTPGVVSRGYGVKLGPQARVGQGELDAARFGDEPALIARVTGAPISVHPRRALAAQALLQAHPRVDVIVSDDGLQHLALARDVEIVVQDRRGIGNGRLLPAGPLREPASRLREVDAVITNIGVPDGRAAASTGMGPRQSTCGWSLERRARSRAARAGRWPPSPASRTWQRPPASAIPNASSAPCARRASHWRRRCRCPTTTTTPVHRSRRWPRRPSWSRPRTRSSAPRCTMRACGKCRCGPVFRPATVRLAGAGAAPARPAPLLEEGGPRCGRTLRVFRRAALAGRRRAQPQHRQGHVHGHQQQCQRQP